MELLKLRIVALAVTALASTSACVPDTDVNESLIEGPRVIAISSEPAEAIEGQKVTYSALFVDQNGLRTEGVLAWFQCSARLPLSELSPISKECLDPSSDKINMLTRGPSISATVPRGSCAAFGPTPPQAEAGEDPPRPVDADATGGYKLPVILGVGTEATNDVVVYEQRLSCNLTGADAVISGAFRQRYRINQNPIIERTTLVREDGSAIIVQGEPITLSAGERVRIDARVPACPTSDECGDGLCGIDETRTDCAEDCAKPIGCGGSERYLRYDPFARELVAERESLRFAWYTTAGSLEEERTGLAEDARGRTSSNTFTAGSAGRSSLFIVARDVRGGVGHVQIDLQVE